MNPKVSLGIAVGILLIAIGYQVFLAMSVVPLNQHIHGKWANIFSSFIVDTKNNTVTILDVAEYPVVKAYEIVKEDNVNIVLNVDGDTYNITFLKDDLVKREMTLIKNNELPAKYILIKEGEKDPTIRPTFIDDPDEKLREYNEKRRRMR